MAVGGVSISRSTTSLNFEHLSSLGEAGTSVSAFVSRPSYQAGIAPIIGNMRAIPDIAADANPETGCPCRKSNPNILMV